MYLIQVVDSNSHIQLQIVLISWFVLIQLIWIYTVCKAKAYLGSAGPGLTLRMIKTSITKTCLYNFDPLKPHFYIVKLGFTGVYIIFLISAQNIDCGPRRDGSNEYPQSMFWAEIWKILEFFIWKFASFLVVKFSIYLNRRVFVMNTDTDKDSEADSPILMP